MVARDGVMSAVAQGWRAILFVRSRGRTIRRGEQVDVMAIQTHQSDKERRSAQGTQEGHPRHWTTPEGGRNVARRSSS